MDQLIVSLLAASTAGPNPTGSKLPATGVNVAVRLLEWPIDKRFPCIDLYRVICLYSAPTSSTLSHLLKNLGVQGNDTVSMLALRAVANAFTTRNGQTVMKEVSLSLINALVGVRSSLSKNGKIALATVALK